MLYIFTGCVNITYLAKDYGISFTVTIDNLTIYNETVSGIHILLFNSYCLFFENL